MTGQEMLDQLALRLEDPNEEVFTEATKLTSLNNNQLRICSFVKQEYLTEIEVLESAVAVAGTPTKLLAFSGLANTPLVDGIQMIADDNGIFCNKVTVKDLKALNNTYLAATTSNPYYYIYSENIYVVPSSITAIDVYYLKQPTALAASATECELATALHWMIVNLAEADLFYQINRLDRAQAAYERAFSDAKIINEKPTLEEAIS